MRPFSPRGKGWPTCGSTASRSTSFAIGRRCCTVSMRFGGRSTPMPAYRGVDALTQKAFDVLTSNKLADALDLEKEDPAVRDRYGRGSADPAFGEDAGPHWMDQFLMARRLVEAGVRCVTLSFGSWDRHGANFERLPEQLGKFDQGITALVEDLHARGLEEDVSVVAWGEFGRTPRINAGGGRDHWPQVSCALLAGGGMRMGQVIGSTNRLGEVPQDRPGSLPRRVRHALPPTRHRRQHRHHPRPRRPPAVSARPPRTDSGIDLGRGMGRMSCRSPSAVADRAHGRIGRCAHCTHASDWHSQTPEDNTNPQRRTVRPVHQKQRISPRGAQSRKTVV